MSLSTAPNAAKSGLKGWHVLAILVGFFGTVMTVNFIMAGYAISTFSGIDGPDTYQRGLDYNKTVAEAAEQDRLGWSNALVFVDGGTKLRLTLQDRELRPIRDLTLSGVIGRGATDQFDRPLTFRATAEGSYEAQLGPMAPGSWLVSLEARGSAGVYRLKERLWLKTAQ